VRRTRVQQAFQWVAPAFAIVTLGALARADAPPGQYDNFDGADIVITDAKTGLIWQRTVTTTTGFAGALASCSGLSLGSYTSQWRLPSYKELLTLVDESPHVEYTTGTAVQIAIDGNAFPETPVASNPFYWSSSLAPGGDVFVVEFQQGRGSLLPLGSAPSANVRCVHDAP